MTKIILSAAFLMLSINGYAQETNNDEWENVTVYEYGAPVTDCKSNFENLFNNWSKFVTNNQHTKLVSYNDVETLTDSSQIARYAKLLNNWTSLSGARVKKSKGREGHSDSTTYTREFYLYPATAQQTFAESDVDSTKKEKSRIYLENILNKKRANFRNKVQIGDKVYVIKLKVDGKKYDHYVVCRPKEHHIVYDNLFLKVNGEKHRLNKIFSSE